MNSVILQKLLEKIETTLSDGDNIIHPLDSLQARNLVFASMMGQDGKNNRSCSGNSDCYGNNNCHGNGVCSKNSSCGEK